MRKSLLLFSLACSLWAGVAGALTLEGSTDALEIVTSSTATTHYHASWSNVTATALTTPGVSTNTISSATTTTIVAAPAASNWRYLRELTIVNAHASTAQSVILQIDRSGTDRRLFSALLAAGESIRLTTEGNFGTYDSQGRLKSTVQNAGQVANTLNTVVLSEAVGNNNPVANTLQDVTGLSFPVTAGESYWWQCTISYTAQAAATGSRWSMSGPTTTALSYRSQYTLAAATVTTVNATAYGIPTASNATSLAAGNIAIIEGVVTPSASGTMQVTHASEVANSLINARAGSQCLWMRTL